MLRTTAILIVIGFVIPTAWAQQQLKIGVVNSEVLVQSLPQFRSIEKTLAKEMEGWQKERASWEADMERLQNVIGDRENSLQAGQNTFSDEKKKKLQADIDSLRKDFNGRLNQQMQMEQERFNQRKAELVGNVLEIVNASIEELGEQSSYNLIIDSSNGTVVYARDPDDLTDQVMRKLKDK
ncbi:MAG: OmpH family outer membrane protein [Calditrichota bacterium]